MVPHTLARDELMHKEAAERLVAWATDQRTKAAAEAERKGPLKHFSAKR